ncbi:NYN domain-containing protein [Gluconacetobacter sp.]|uniref:NYN domain-containing protein n=1 Tax=Gluconacetobacter sp. TaxID=1935994 RepID=UPI0039E8FE06
MNTSVEKPHIGKTHIFMDNSNIFGGAQRTAREKESAPWKSVRIDYQKLFAVIGRKRASLGTSMLAGSVPPGNDALWEAAQTAGFDTTLLRRVESDDGRLIEQGVDEALHLKIGNILLDEDQPGTIVLLTGDGATTEQECSFTKQVERAAKRGWKVEIWSWRSQLSPKLRDMRLRFPDLVTVNYLDEWYWGLVFLKAGEYDVKGDLVVVQGRRTQGIDLTDSAFAAARETT